MPNADPQTDFISPFHTHNQLIYMDVAGRGLVSVSRRLDIEMADGPEARKLYK